eukprot:13655857-Alexandrium_andersonii.AAC.1
MKSHLAEADHDHPTTIALTKMIPWKDTLWWKCAQGLGSQEDPSIQHRMETRMLLRGAARTLGA